MEEKNFKNARDPLGSKLCFSVSETVKILGISKPSLYRYIENGLLPHRKIGGRVLIDRETIENFGKVEVKK